MKSPSPTEFDIREVDCNTKFGYNIRNINIRVFLRSDTLKRRFRLGWLPISRSDDLELTERSYQYPFHMLLHRYIKMSTSLASKSAQTDLKSPEK